MRPIITSAALLAAPLLAMLALSACKKEPQTQAEVKQEIAGLPKPKPGLYKLETKLVKLEVPGMPPAQQEQVKKMFAQQAGTELCLTKADADKGYEEMTKKLGEGKCSFDKFEVKGSALDAHLACVTGKNMKAEVAMTGQLSAEGSQITTTMQQSGQTIVSEATMTRTGDCPGA